MMKEILKAYDDVAVTAMKVSQLRVRQIEFQS